MLLVRLRSSSPAQLSQHAAVVTLLLVCICVGAAAQRQLPYLDAARNSPFAQVDFEEIYRDRLILGASQTDGGPEQFQSGTVSALDMSAPAKALHKLQEATSLLKAQKAKEAVQFLQKAIQIYPKFVSAHIVLGLAYFDLKDNRAKEEFETATKLDDQFPISFLYLGMMSLWSNDFTGADASLEKAAFLSPNDPQILNALAFAQNGAHKYKDVLNTVGRIHKLDHHGMADVHYIAAAAALSMHDVDSIKSQLRAFLNEEPAGPLSAVARQRLDELTRGKEPLQTEATPPSIQSVDTRIVTFPNSPRLASELMSAKAAAESPDDSPADFDSDPSISLAASPGQPASTSWTSPFTIRQSVDETALFLAVSDHGNMVNDISLSDIRIRDDNNAPERILQFLPQSKLPLRLGVLIDISGSVENRIAFEQTAAKRFFSTVLNPESDLAFVAGFDNGISVQQDFTGDSTALERGVDNLTHQGEGTAVFDAIHYACWKLAAYPDQSRVARVLVVLTDGEDNASHRSLEQSIEAAETAGVTVYTINTSANIDLQTDANKILRLIAERSGGESVRPRNLGELERYFQQLSDAIRSRYLIAYKPANLVPDGSYHRLKVTAEHDGKRLQVHVRKGYYARMASENQATSQVAESRKATN